MSQNSQIFDPKFINPFVDGAKVTLETQVGLKVTAQKPYVKPANVVIENIDIAGIINLSSEHFKGAIAICFSAPTFLKIYEKMVGESHTELTDEVKDGAGELINIIFGQAKQSISNSFKISLGMAIPTVLIGSNLQVVFQSKLPTIILPFRTEVGDLHLEIVIDSKAIAGAA